MTGSAAIAAISYQRNFPQAPSHSLGRLQNQEEKLPRLRPVLKGALFRSGTPNEEALGQLCEAGWKRVYSLYGEHTTQEGPRNANMLRHGRDVRTCTPAASEPGAKTAAAPRSLEWRSAPSSRMRNLPLIFKDIIDSIRNPQNGPVLVHCWNGLHYAGMVSALALRQFCGLTAEQSEAYWRANANRGANYPLIIANLYQFKPIDGLTLTPEEQAAVCPDLSKSLLVTSESFNGTPSPGPTSGIYAATEPQLSRPASANVASASVPAPSYSPSLSPAGDGISPAILPASTPAPSGRSGSSAEPSRGSPSYPTPPLPSEGNQRSSPTSAGVTSAAPRVLPAKG